MGVIPGIGTGTSQSQMALQVQQQQQTATNAHVGREATIHADAVTLTPAARFQAEVAHFGDSIKSLPQGQRDQVAQIQQQVQSEYSQAQQNGTAYDPFSQFAGRTVQWAGDGLKADPLNQQLGGVFDYGAAAIDAQRAMQQAQQ